MSPKEIYKFIIEQSPEPLIKNPVLRNVVNRERLGFYLGKKVPSEGTIEDADTRKAEDALSGVNETMKVADLQRQGHIGHYYSKGGEVNQLVSPSVDGSRPGYGGRPKKPITDYSLKVQKFIKDYGIEKYNKLPNHQQLNVRKGNKNVGTGAGSQSTIYKDKPKYTKKVIEELSKDLPKGVHYNKQYNKFVGTLTGPDGKKVTKSLVATEANKKIMIDWADTTKTKLYPNRLTDDEFKKLRLENKKLSNVDFAKFLNKKNKTTDLGYGFDAHSVNTRNLSLFPDKKFGPYVFRTVDEAKEIIKRYPDNKYFFDLNPSDSEITAKASDLLAQDKAYGKSGKQFRTTGTTENRMFSNFYESSKKSDGRMKLMTKVPIDKDGEMNWTMKDKDGTPAWKKAKFYDTKTGATFTWGKNYKFGDLKKQVDAAYGDGFFNQSTKVYADQKKLNKMTFKGRSLNEWLREGLLKKELEVKLDRPLTNSKADKKLLKDFFAKRKKYFSFTEAHHTEGVGKNPFRMEVSYRAANRKQADLLNSYKAGNLTKAEYITGMENLSDTQGGIKYKTDGRFIGTTGTQQSMATAAAKDAGLEKKLKSLLVKLCPKGQASGGRIGFALGSGAKCGGRRLEQILLRGTTNKNEQLLANAIIKGGRELMAVRNLLGPVALATGVAFEAGLVGFDMLNEGKTFREAVGDSLFNYALGDKTKIDPKEERYKRYKASGIGEDEIGKIALFENNIDQINQIGEQFAKPDDALYQAGAAYINPRVPQARKDKLMQNYLDAVDETAAFNQDLFRSGQAQFLDTFDYGAGQKALEEADRTSEYQRLLDKQDSLFTKFFRGDRSKQRLKEEIEGLKQGLAGGGIAGIRRPSAVPPQSGPLPDGLPGVLKRVKNI